jgi:hypothetical protein
MASTDVYLELVMVFVVSFLILSFSTTLGEQLIFMFVAFILSGIISTVFVSGIKGIINHPLIAKRASSENAQPTKLMIHEMKYLFLVFFIFIILSTLIDTALSEDLINNLLYPSLGTVPGKILVSGILTIVTYVEMLSLFGEKIINQTTLGMIGILVVLVVVFVAFSGQTHAVVAYFENSINTVWSYASRI